MQRQADDRAPHGAVHRGDALGDPHRADRGRPVRCGSAPRWPGGRRRACRCGGCAGRRGPRSAARDLRAAGVGVAPSGRPGAVGEQPALAGRRRSPGRGPSARRARRRGAAARARRAGASRSAAVAATRRPGRAPASAPRRRRGRAGSSASGTSSATMPAAARRRAPAAGGRGGLTRRSARPRARRSGSRRRARCGGSAGRRGRRRACGAASRCGRRASWSSRTSSRPRPGHQVLARDDAPGVAGQLGEQVELLARELELAPVDRRAARGRVDLEVAQHDRRASARRAAARPAQDGADARDRPRRR